MSNVRSKEERGLEALMNTMAESLLDVPDEDFLRQAQEDGVDVARTAAGVRGVLLEGIKMHRQRRLYDAMAEYKKQVELFKKKQYALPSKPDERRDLLASIFTRYPQMQNTFLTVQHRDFKNFSDADIESFLKQLQALGVLGQN